MAPSSARAPRARAPALRCATLENEEQRMRSRIAMKLVLTMLAGATLWGPAAAQTPPAPRMVIVISLDGFPAYAMDDAKLPVPTLLTGVRADEHGLLVNGSLVPTGTWPPIKVDPMVDKVKMVHAPTVYDAAHKAGLTTAQIDWVAINNAPTITWQFNEWATPGGPGERDMIRQGALSAADVADFTKANILFRDQIWTRAAVYLIREHRPNLMLLHFLSLDSVHHAFGPKSLAATSAMAFLDSCVEKVVAAVHEIGMDDRTTFLIVADHGFKAYTKEIRPAVALAAAGLTGKVHVIPEGGTAMVYLDQAQAVELLPKAVQALQGLEGVGQVVGQDGFAALGLPTPDKDPQMSQLLLTAKDGYSFSGATGGPVTAAVAQQRGSHGYLASDPEKDALFIASGYGVRAGALSGQISNLDVAPTIAKLLGVPLPSAKGKPLPLQ